MGVVGMNFFLIVPWLFGAGLAACVWLLAWGWATDFGDRPAFPTKHEKEAIAAVVEARSLGIDARPNTGKWSFASQRRFRREMERLDQEAFAAKVRAQTDAALDELIARRGK